MEKSTSGASVDWGASAAALRESTHPAKYRQPEYSGYGLWPTKVDKRVATEYLVELIDVQSWVPSPSVAKLGQKDGAGVGGPRSSPETGANSQEENNHSIS